MFKKIMSLVVMLVVMATVFINVNAADNQSYTYTYDYKGEVAISPDVYKVDTVFSGKTLGVGSLNAPQDIFIDDNGDIYIVDTENHRIVVSDSLGNFKRTYTEFYLDGTVSKLNEPYGIYVNSSNEMLIADRKNKRVIRSDMNGNIIQEYKQPVDDGKNSIIFSGIDFLPEKVVEDINGYVFVLCHDMYQGALIYKNSGEFMGYYGANKTAVTAAVLTNHFWRKFMTEEQREKTSIYLPYQFDNFYIDDNGFIFTSTEISEDKTNQIKKLNAKGLDVMRPSSTISQEFSNKYGDLKVKIANATVQQTILVDVTVDKEGYITTVDRSRGHIFQYDKNSNLIAAFGGLGDQEGYFRNISSVENYNGKLYVLDNEKNDVTVFTTTKYGDKLRNAVNMYNDSAYVEAEDEWRDIISMNCNFQMGHSAIGKIYYEKGDYKSAMEYFEIGEDKANYIKAFEMYRNNVLRRWAFPVILGAVILFIISYVVKLIIKFKKKGGQQ